MHSVPIPSLYAFPYMSGPSLIATFLIWSMSDISRPMIFILLYLLEFYNWKGLIAHKYDDFKYPSSTSQYSLAKAYSMNPDYPNVTSSYQCKPTLYDQSGHRFDYYALRYIGYMNLSANGRYKFKMHCNEICQFFLTKNGTETSLGDYSDEWEYM